MNSTIDFQVFMREGEAFLQKILSDLQTLGVIVEKETADHLCFRVQTEDEYTDYKNFLSAHGTLLTETPVNGRLIATFKLARGFRADQQAVQLVEIPAPKSGSLYVTGFEHVEFVIRESFESFEHQYPDLRFSQSHHNALNPELCLKLGKHQVKFHHLSLERVIEIEKAQQS